MARIQQREAYRGSQKWLQLAVNRQPALLDDLILPKLVDATHVSWHSPLKQDDYAEYRDADFLQKLSVANLASDLAVFWPSRGPQWDALACSDRDDIILVEAKAHIGELCSPATQARAASLTQIQEALEWTAQLIGAKPHAPWTDLFYQLANRIAHLCFLRKHGLRAWLVLVNFVGDDEMQGPSTEEEWRAAYQIVWHVLGIPQDHSHHTFIVDIYPSMKALPAR